MTTTLSRPDYSWLAGNDRLKNLSGQLLGAHIAHAGLNYVLGGSNHHFRGGSLCTVFAYVRHKDLFCYPT